MTQMKLAFNMPNGTNTTFLKQQKTLETFTNKLVSKYCQITDTPLSTLAVIV